MSAKRALERPAKLCVRKGLKRAPMVSVKGSKWALGYPSVVLHCMIENMSYLSPIVFLPLR